MTDSAGGSQRCARVGAPGRGGGRSASETRWRRHIVGQLKHRDLSQHAKFQDLIRFCTTHKYTFIICLKPLQKGWFWDMTGDVKSGCRPNSIEKSVNLTVC
uniref:Uncharacterized protein n=1 Tax=Sander lucioperca TaxID=283035 RepID=A0A8C9Z1R8_SANLU